MSNEEMLSCFDMEPRELGSDMAAIRSIHDRHGRDRAFCSVWRNIGIKMLGKWTPEVDA